MVGGARRRLVAVVDVTLTAQSTAATLSVGLIYRVSVTRSTGNTGAGELQVGTV